MFLLHALFNSAIFFHSSTDGYFLSLTILIIIGKARIKKPCILLGVSVLLPGVWLTVKLMKAYDIDHSRNHQMLCE